MINNADINKIVVSNKFPFDKQDFKYFSGYKDNKEIRFLCIFFPELSIYKRYSDKTKYMCFIIKGENIFNKYMTVWEKVGNIIEKINSELIYNKKYLTAKKRSHTQKSFQYFYIPVILFDSVYRKDGNYYPNVFFETFIQNVFWRCIINFGCWSFGGSS